MSQTCLQCGCNSGRNDFCSYQCADVFQYRLAQSEAQTEYWLDLIEEVPQ